MDDEPDVAAVLVDLVRLDGYGVETAANGAEAMARIRDGGYDAILTDSKMPVMDGVSFHAEIERLHPQMARRLVFVSGDVVSPDKRELLERIGAPPSPSRSPSPTSGGPSGRSSAALDRGDRAPCPVSRV
ncbi:MAG: response regulator [Candidatus Rokuibacteriota bacterium]